MVNNALRNISGRLAARTNRPAPEIYAELRAGLNPGDRILKIEGQTTKDMTLMDAVRKLRGPKGSKVTISRGGASGPSCFRTCSRSRTITGQTVAQWA